jgi:hypothetical protein
MEETNHKDHAALCTACKSCGRGCICGGTYRRHPLIRILLALIVLFFVFAAGIRLGEMKAGWGEGYRGHRGMMGAENGYYLTYPDPTVVPATTPVAPATPAPAVH